MSLIDTMVMIKNLVTHQGLDPLELESGSAPNSSLQANKFDCTDSLPHLDDAIAAYQAAADAAPNECPQRAQILARLSHGQQIWSRRSGTGDFTKECLGFDVVTSEFQAT